MTNIVEVISFSFSESKCKLVGELTRQAIMKIPKKSFKQILAAQSLVLDLQDVSRVDTAGLAWLFYLLEQASGTRCQLSFSNIPDKLNKLISLSGVEGFLPIDS